MADNAKLCEVRDFVREHRELLNMNDWITGGLTPYQTSSVGVWYAECGLTACIGGWTTLLNGWEPVPPSEPGIWHVRPVGTTDPSLVRAVQDVAAEILGLTAWETRTLFYCAEKNLDTIIDRILTGTLQPTAQTIGTRNRLSTWLRRLQDFCCGTKSVEPARTPATEPSRTVRPSRPSVTAGVP